MAIGLVTVSFLRNGDVKCHTSSQSINFIPMQPARLIGQIIESLFRKKRGLNSRIPQKKGCCQTNEPKHQYSFDGYVYEVTNERHSVRAASRFSLNVLRFESDLCELNRL